MNRVPSPNERPFTILFFWLACLASVACSSGDGANPTDESVNGSTKRDAGSARARDAGKTKDAKVAEPADEPDDDDAEPADEEDDAEPADKEDVEDDDTKPAAKDAGTGAKQDAGKQSSTDAGPAMPAATESCDELTYATFGEMFLKSYCYECHSAKVGSPLGGVVLDTRAGITKHMGNLKRMVIPRADGKQPAMPKGGNPALTDAERLKFGKWIDCGAK